MVKLKLETLSFEIVTSVNVLGIFGKAVIVRVVSAVAEFQLASELRKPLIVTVPASSKLIVVPLIVAIVESDEVKLQKPFEFVVGATMFAVPEINVPEIGAKAPTVGVPLLTVRRATREVALKAPLAA